MRRRTLLWFPLLLGWSETAPAQEAQSSFCYRARPKPACSAFAFTNFGTYLVLGSDIKTGDTPVRAVADWGVMANVDSRNAIGVSVRELGPAWLRCRTGPPLPPLAVVYGVRGRRRGCAAAG